MAITPKTSFHLASLSKQFVAASIAFLIQEGIQIGENNDGIILTQIGGIAENLVANELMIESKGRLLPFQPIADDDGIDVSIYDKVTGRAVPIQIKARTSTIKKKGPQERGNVPHFEVRKSSHRDDHYALLLCVLLSPDLRSTELAWLLSLDELSF